MPDNNDETPTSAALEFANAFASEGDDASKQAAEAAAKAAEQAKDAGASGGDGDKSDDPLAGLTLDQLLKHPELGKVLNSWNDKTTNSRLQSERQAGQVEGVQQGKAQATSEQRNAYFSGLSDDELATELRDPKVRSEYTKWESERQAAQQGGDAETTARTAQVLSMALDVSEYTERLEGSELAAEAKAKLAASNYTHLGPAGLKQWKQAIDDALVDARAEKLATSKAQEREEAERQQAQADADAGRPAAFRAPARHSGVLPDLLKTPSASLFEHAFGAPQK